MTGGFIYLYIGYLQSAFWLQADYTVQPFKVSTIDKAVE